MALPLKSTFFILKAYAPSISPFGIVTVTTLLVFLTVILAVFPPIVISFSVVPSANFASDNTYFPFSNFFVTLTITFSFSGTYLLALSPKFISEIS